MDIFVACDNHSRNGNVYSSKAEALAALARWRSRGTVKGNPQPFKCRARRHWHLGRDRRFRWRTAA